MARPLNSRDKKGEAGKVLSESFGKGAFGRNGPNLSNKRQSLSSAEPEETIEVKKVANHFHDMEVNIRH